MIKDLKSISSLLLSVAFSSIGFIAAITVTTLAAREVSSSPLFLGFPNAVGVAGAVLGTRMIFLLSNRFSRLTALTLTFLTGAIGGLILFYSLVTNSFLFLIFGAFILGIGQSATLQARYAASFISREKFTATALSLAVWFSVFGSVFGPRLISSYSEFFDNIFNSELIVGYIVALFGMFFASLSMLAFTSKNNLLRKPSIIENPIAQEINAKKSGNLLSLVLVLNHFIMVVIMSATPLHIQDIGETVKLVGVVISYHTLGMFLFSPILGKYVDKFGYKYFTYAGTIILLLSCLIILLYPEPTGLKIGLYLLGLGWNFNYVSISAAISKFSTKFKTPLNIQSDSYVFIGSFVAHASLGLSYLMIGFQGLIFIGIFVSLYLIYNLKNLHNLNI